MEILELKNIVKQHIDAVNDDHLLEEILYILESASNNDHIFCIPEEHQKELDLSLSQMKNGQVLSDVQLNERFAKWV